MKKQHVNMVGQYLFGALLVFFGLNKFFHFFQPPEGSESAMALMEAIITAGYFFPVIGVMMLLVGAMMLLGRYVALGAVLFAPISVNILLFHIFLDPATIGMALLVSVLNGWVLWANRASYKAMLKA